jgi:hypothetical protein
MQAHAADRRIVTSREFRRLGTPVIFCAMSAEADHGYVFV